MLLFKHHDLEIKQKSRGKGLPAPTTFLGKPLGHIRGTPTASALGKGVYACMCHMHTHFGLLFVYVNM